MTTGHEKDRQVQGNRERLGDPLREDELTRPISDRRETRGKLAIILVVASLLGLGAAAIVSLVQGQWMPLATVWAVGGPFLGRISAYYFPYAQ